MTFQIGANLFDEKWFLDYYNVWCCIKLATSKLVGDEN